MYKGLSSPRPCPPPRTRRGRIGGEIRQIRKSLRNVRIVVEQRENALKVPDAAPRFRPSAAAEDDRVWTLKSGEPVDVRLGLTDGKSSEVPGGALEEGEKVVGLAHAPRDD